jgi:hypothetical protein
MTMGVLEKHALQPKHLSDASMRGGEARRFLGQNHTPKMVVEGTDFRLAMEAEAVRRGNTSREDLSPEEELDDTESNQGLVNISVTPQLLAELLDRKTGAQTLYVPTDKRQISVPGYDPTMPEYTPTGLPGQASLFRPAVPERSPLVRSKAVTATTATLPAYQSSATVSSPFMPIRPLVSSTSSTSVFTAVSTSPYVPVDCQYVPSFGDSLTNASLDTLLNLPTLTTTSAPATTTTTVASVMPAVNETLNTPVVHRTPLDFTGTPEVEDISGQLLGRDESESCFSPVTTRVDKGSQTKVTHTKTDLTPTASSMAITQLSETIRIGMEKIYQALERNSRRIEEVNRTMGTVADSITRMERSVDNVVMRQNVQGRRSECSDSGNRKPRLESKENRPPKMQSVVKDPKRSGK